MDVQRFTGALNLAGATQNSHADTPITAADVEYDPSSSGLVATDVQSAVDELDGRIDAIPSVGPMTPTVRGTCMGLQDQQSTTRFLGLGYNVKSGSKSTVLFNSSGPSVVQKSSSANSFVVLNNVDEITPGSFSATSGVVVGGAIDGLSAQFSAMQTSYCDFTSTLVSESVMLAQNMAVPDTTQSVVVTTSCPEAISDTIAESVIIGRFNENIKTGNITGCTIIGALGSISGGDKTGCIIITSATPSNTITPALGSLLIGIPESGYTQSPREMTICDYTKFVMKTIPTGVKTNLLYYDSSTGELARHDLTPGTIGRTTEVIARDPSTQGLFAVPVGNTTITKVLRGSATTNSSGLVNVDLSSFGFATANDYSVSATGTSYSPLQPVTFSVVKTSTTASIRGLVYDPIGAFVSAINYPVDFLISY